MRVLHAISGIDASAGGTATALSRWRRRMRAAGLDVSVAATYAGRETDAAARLRVHGIDVHHIGPANRRWRAIRKSSRRCES
jgi:hypothetical protein